MKRVDKPSGELAQTLLVEGAHLVDAGHERVEVSLQLVGAHHDVVAGLHRAPNHAVAEPTANTAQVVPTPRETVVVRPSTRRSQPRTRFHRAVRPGSRSASVTRLCCPK